MNVLLIGSGAREHALASAIRRSPSLSALYITPGNPGTATIGTNLSLDWSNHEACLRFLSDNHIELVIIGSEQPLVEGVSDFLRDHGYPVFGPSRAAAAIESSKVFAKQIMAKMNVPTAAYKNFVKDDLNNALDYVRHADYPLVIKADGLAAGKGVAICHTIDDAESVLQQMLIEQQFGLAGAEVLIEEFLDGEEASVFAVTDGEKFVCLPAAQDHKRIGEGDTGKNTGGMGAYAPAPLMTQELMDQVAIGIIEPVLRGMREESVPFNGCLYCGLMITSKGPKVVEFNCRFGDPETQVVLPLLEGDILELFYSAAAGDLHETAVAYNGKCAVTVVMASSGYPDAFSKGLPLQIQYPPASAGKEIQLLHAGTAYREGTLVTAGGRVVSVTAIRDDGNLKNCISDVYDAVKAVSFPQSYFRKDIGAKALRNLVSGNQS